MFVDSPRVSVILPCRNEARHIEACLAGLLKQEPVEGGMEIVIADGMSDDGTRELLERLAAREPRLRVVDNAKRTTPCALNAAVRASRGEIIVRVDAHTEYDRDYVIRSVEELVRTGADNVGGPKRPLGDTLFTRANAAAFRSPFSTGGARFHRPDYEGWVDTVTYGCWWKERLVSLGMFDEELTRNQDDELNLRTRLAGGRIWQSPRIRSRYRPRTSLRRLFRQQLQYGYFRVRVMQKHGRTAAARHLVPIAFVLWLIVGGVLAFASPTLAAFYGLTVGAYAAVLAWASLSAAAREGWDLAPVLPIVFAAFHFGYGTGFGLGLVDFVILGRSARQTMKQVSYAPAQACDGPTEPSLSGKKAA